MSEPTIDFPKPESESELPTRLLRKLRISIPGFKLASVVGRGGQAIVLKGVQVSTGKTVAIKLLREGRLADPTARERLLREVAVLATLSHPNIVSVIDRGVTPDGEDYLVMNFIAGQSLRTFLDQRQAAAADQGIVDTDDPASLLKLFGKICHAIDFAHQRGVIHRDLCPSNILIDERGEPQILDFGLARTTFDHHLSDGTRKLSVTGEFLGKLAYASPEQARGESDQINNATDVYALGVILYEILTGQYPYNVVGNIEEILRNIIHNAPTPPSELVAARDARRVNAGQAIRRQQDAGVNPVIEAIVLKALAKNPAERYHSAGELARDIESYLAGKPTSARLVKSRRIAQRSFLKKAASKRLAWMALVIALCGVGWGLVHWLGDKEPALLDKEIQPADVESSEAAGKATDALLAGSIWRGRGRYGGPITLTVLSRDGDKFNGRLSLPGQRGGNVRVEGTIRGASIRWANKESSLSAFAGTLEGDEMATQPIHYYETRGPVTFHREK